MKVRPFSVLALGAGLLARTAALKALPGPLTSKRVLIHLKTGFKQDDNQPCVAFDVALAAVKQGAEVTFHGTMARLTSLSNGVHDVGQQEPIAKPLSLAEILQHRARADIYFVC